MAGGTMKKWISAAVMLSVAAFAGGCNTTGKSEFANVQAAISGSPALRKQAIADCKKEIPFQSQSDKANVAALMNVSVAQVPSVFCTRSVGGVASGRITYEDFVAAKRGGDISRIIKVLQGR
jgi:hypothetical protein